MYYEKFPLILRINFKFRKWSYRVRTTYRFRISYILENLRNYILRVFSWLLISGAKYCMVIVDYFFFLLEVFRVKMYYVKDILKKNKILHKSVVTLSFSN